MKKTVTLGLGLCAAIAFTSCKSQESAYKKAYEKAKQQQAAEQPPATEEVAVVPEQTVTPVQTDATAAAAEVSVRSESVDVVDGAGLKAFSVVCGSFASKANAQGLQRTLSGQGYAAQIAFNGTYYRVVASTFDDKPSAAASCRKLRGTYPDAWLLYNK